MKTYRNPALSFRLRALIAAVPTAFAISACDGATDANNPSNTNEVAVAGFALSADDESDDGFDADADYTPILDELDTEVEDDGSDTPPADEVDTEPAPTEGPDRIARTVLISWGQPRLNPAMAETRTAWNGRVTTDVGAMRILRTVQFERGELGSDHLVRDEDPQSVSFETTTTVHHDGILVRLVLPRDPSAVTGNFTFETDHFTQTVPLAAIIRGGQHAFRADDLGNGVVIGSHLPHRCPNGMTRLRWERRNERGGVVGGKFFGPDGEVAGYVVGLWGEVDGRRRIKGAVLGADRAWRGTLKGSWRPFPAEADRDGGAFRGLWLGPAGAVRGVIGGLYSIGDEVAEGSAHGFWRLACEGAALSCGADLDLPEPPAASCECAPGEDAEASSCACEVRPPEMCVPAEPPAPPAAAEPESPSAE
jgi:hypothetical protein